MERCVNSLKRRIIFITISIPLTIILIIGFNGDNLHDAIKHSIEMVTQLPNALMVWALLIIFNILIYFQLKPVFRFWGNFNNGKESSLALRNRVMFIFNTLGKKIAFINIIAFVLGSSLTSIEYFNRFQDFLPMTYVLFEGFITGLFVAALSVMSLDHIFFPIKRALMMDPPIIRPKYQSYYKKMTYIILLLLTFLCFQIFSVSTDFYKMAAVGAKNIFNNNSGPDFIISPEIFISKIGRNHNEAGNLLDVFGIKILFYFLLTFRILNLLKKSLKNPITTVEERLEQLSKGKVSKNSKIDIVENNEYSKIYSDINKLIERQQNEIEISQNRLHTIIDNAADPIVSFDNEGKIYIFNPAAEKLFQWHWDEIQGTPFSILFDPNSDCCKQSSNDNKMFINILTNKENKLTRFIGQTKNGKNFTFEANFSSSITPDGIIYTAIIRDISAQLLFEESLKSAKIAAEKANELKSEFLANMSHELRTPLNAVLGFSQILNSDKNLTDSQVEKLNIISRSGEHLLGLINDILDISKIEAGKIELHDSIFNLKDFSEDLRQMLDLKCKKKGLALYVEYVDPLPKFVKTDLGKLRQIMINILGNAIKFTKEGGISIVVGVENDKLRFSINDTGKGIPQSEIKSILEPFTQSSLTDNEGGTGLGLAITNSFIKMMGGSLDIESKEGVGSTFSFSIDYEESKTAIQSREDDRTILGIEDDRHPTVIIVDDKLNNRLILKEMLERVGFVTIEAENGLDAFEKTKDIRPELVFMDIKMPIMDGYESVRKIKAEPDLKDIPVFALTASAFKHDEKSILNSGFDGFIAKPFKLSSLFSLINEKSNINFVYEIPKAEKKDISIDDLNIKSISNKLTIELIDQIDDLVLINDFAGVKSLLNSLEDRNDLEDFIETVNYLTDNFDDENLIKLIENIKKI